MSALFVLIGISLTVACCFLIAFLWAVRKGQYEDDYTPSVRMLFENETFTQDYSQREMKTNEKNQSNQQ